MSRIRHRELITKRREILKQSIILLRKTIFDKMNIKKNGYRSVTWPSLQHHLQHLASCQSHFLLYWARHNLNLSPSGYAQRPLHQSSSKHLYKIKIMTWECLLISTSAITGINTIKIQNNSECATLWLRTYLKSHAPITRRLTTRKRESCTCKTH